VNAAVGDAFTLTTCEKVLVQPLVEVTVKDAVYVPEAVYVYAGFCSDEVSVVKVASPKSQR
jgi:hypothetical protein